MNKKIALMEKNHQEALDFIKKSCESDKPEMQAITKYLLDTDANPYGFLPPAWAGAMTTSTGFASLLGMIHHALFDDGDISFPVVNKEPRIAFVWRHEKNYEDYVLSEQEKQLKEKFGSEYRIEHCENVLDWISRHKDYHRKDILDCYVQDAARNGWEFANRHYSRYANFDPDWEFDESVVAKVEKIKKDFGF